MLNGSVLPTLQEMIGKQIFDHLNEIDLSLPRAAYNQDICQLLERTVLLGGKRFRPMLVFIMGDLWGIPLSSLRCYAEVIEKVHAASLSHDDVIDVASTRRGQTSINIVGGNKQAILAGDYLLAQVIHDMCQLQSWPLLSELSQVIQDLALGEWLQVDLAKRRFDLRFEEIALVAEKKTSSVIRWCCLVAPILKNAPQEEIEICRDFGRKLGLAFQFIDDTIDYSHTALKDFGQDLKNGVMSIVTYELMSAHPTLVGEILKNRESLYQINNSGTKIFHPAVDEALKKVRARAELYIQSCLEDLQNLEKKVKQRGEWREEAHQSLVFLMHLLLHRDN